MGETVASDTVLDEIDRKLINALQGDFPLVTEPYRLDAEAIGLSEAEVLRRFDSLLESRMLTQFETRHFQHLEGDEVARLYDPAPARWPDHYACWSQEERRIIDLPAPDPADAASWTAALRADWEGCAATPRD